MPITSFTDRERPASNTMISALLPSVFFLQEECHTPCFPIRSSVVDSATEPALFGLPCGKPFSFRSHFDGFRIHAPFHSSFLPQPNSESRAQLVLLCLALNGLNRGPFHHRRRISLFALQTQSQMAWTRKIEHNTSQSPGAQCAQ